MVAGFQLDGRFRVEEYDRSCDASGLAQVERWSSWDRQPFRTDSHYVVSVHRRAGPP